MTPLWESLNVSKVIVLLIEYPQGEGGELAFHDKDRAEEDMLGIIFSAIEGEEKISLKKIEIQYEDRGY